MHLYPLEKKSNPRWDLRAIFHIRWVVESHQRFAIMDRFFEPGAIIDSWFNGLPQVYISYNFKCTILEYDVLQAHLPKEAPPNCLTWYYFKKSKRIDI